MYFLHCHPFLFSSIPPQGNSPFKRQFSLRLSDLPSTLERQQHNSLQLEGLSELVEEEETMGSMMGILSENGNSGFEFDNSAMKQNTTPAGVINLKNQLNQLYQLSEAQHRAQQGNDFLRLIIFVAFVPASLLQVV
jgi:hypothetical protein